jgi:hypothetical protein
VEVLLASMQCGGQYFSRSEKICCFKETFSITACFKHQEQIMRIELFNFRIENSKVPKAS